jgi:RNA polymerase sigma factor (sigma-70 family)
LKQYPLELIDAARAGNPDAINELLMQCHPDVKQFARALCATPEDAEDAVQEVLWVVSTKIGALRVTAAFTRWLFRVVKTYCLRLIRITRREVSLDAALELPADMEAVFGRANWVRDIAEAIAALPLIYRETLILRDVEELTAPETAATLGISVAAVKSRLHRARSLVRLSLLSPPA